MPAVVIATAFGGPEVLSVTDQPAPTEIRDAARLELTRLAQAGTLRVFVTKTFPLADAAAAHREIMNGHTVGKIALIP